MDRRVRTGLGVVALVVVVVAAFLIGRAVSSGDGKEVATGATTTSTAAVTTTLGGEPTATTGGPVTGAPATTAGPAPSDPGTVVTDAGALLEPAPQPTLQSTNGPDSDCTTLGDASWTLDGCAPVAMAGGTWVWLTEYRPSGALKEWQAYVLHWSQGKGAWLTDLRLSETMGIAQVNVRQLDLTGDGKAEMVFGFHRTGSGSILVYDIVSGSASPLAVSASRQLSHGRATVTSGGITDYEAKYPNGEPNCCPAYIQVSEVTYSGGQFRVVETGHDDAGTGPPPDSNDI